MNDGKERTVLLHSDILLNAPWDELHADKAKMGGHHAGEARAYLFY
jgi:hypothetical protein